MNSSRTITSDSLGCPSTDLGALVQDERQNGDISRLHANGNFGLLTSLAHEYRSNSLFATSGDSVRVAPGYRMITFKLEIRIQTAVVSYQFRNLLQEKYQQVPGFPYPRQSQFYGVRWEFWN